MQLEELLELVLLPVIKVTLILIHRLPLLGEGLEEGWALSLEIGIGIFDWHQAWQTFD